MKEDRLGHLFRQYRDGGDASALGEVFDGSSAELLKIALHLLGDEEKAEDLVHDAFLTLLEIADRYDETRPFMPWLVGILGKLAQAARSETRRKRERHALESEPVSSAADEPRYRELARAVSRTLEELPGGYRDVLYLRLHYELEPVEIARTLGRRRATVRSQLARGLARLRRELPAGAAVPGLAVLMPRRGLGAVRAHVLRRAAETRGSLTRKTALLGAKAGVLLVLGSLTAGLALYLASPSEPSATGRLAAVDSVDERARLPRRAGLETPPEHAPSGEPASSAPAGEPAPEEPDAAPSSSSTLEARVVCEGTPLVVPAAQVIATRIPGGQPHRREITDERGIARFTDLPAGRYCLFVGRSRMAASRLVRHELEAGVTSQLTLEVVRGIDIDGIVVDRRGAPIEGAGIWLGYMPDQGCVVTRSGPGGRFHLRAMRSGLCLGARLRGFAPSPVRRLDYAPGTTRARVRLAVETPGTNVSGTVVDAAGKPRPGVKVFVGQPRGAAMTFPDGASGFEAPGVSAVTDANGRFDVVDASPGVRHVLASHEGYAPWRRELRLEPRGHAEIEITLELGAVLAGVVRDEAGATVAGAEVYLGTFNDLSFRSTTSDAGGRYRITGLARGELRVTAAHERGIARRALTFASGEETGWDPVLGTGRKIRGAVEDGAGRPLGGWFVRAYSPEAPILFVTTDSDGSFELESSVDSEFRVEAYSPEGGPSAAVATRVRPGAAPLTLRVDGSLAATARFHGRAAEDGSGSVPIVDFAAVDMTWGRRLVIDEEDGAFGHGPVPPGRYVLRVRRGEHTGPWRGPFALAPNERRDLGDVEDLPTLAADLTVRVDSQGRHVVIEAGAAPATEGPSTCSVPGNDTKRQ